MKREYVYRAFERFWHWTQAALILFLAVTGFEIHGSLRFFGFEQAVRYHSIAAVALPRPDRLRDLLARHDGRVAAVRPDLDEPPGPGGLLRRSASSGTRRTRRGRPSSPS